MDVGGKLLSRIVKEGDAHAFFRFKLSPLYFDGQELELFQFVKNFADSYATLPTVDTVMGQFPELPAAAEPAEYYMDKVEERFIHRTMKLEMFNIHEMLGNQQVYEAHAKLQQLNDLLTFHKLRQQIVDFGQEVAGIVADAYDMAQGKGGQDAIFFGWPYLDNMTSGLTAGDVVSYIGRPALGKTYFVLNQARYNWHVQGKDTMVVSMEMDTVPLAQRLAALQTHVGIDTIKGITPFPNFPKDMKMETLAKLTMLQDEKTKLWIVNGNLTATVDEIYAMVNHYRPKVLFIDGAYLLGHDNGKLDRFKRVTENIEAIKRKTSIAKIPTICSFQFNREAAKKAKKVKSAEKDQGDLEDIGSSDAIGQVSSIVLGLFKEDSVETIKKRTIRVLKGREGATGEFDVHWDFVNMDFSEVKPMHVDQAGENPADLLYV